MRMNQDERRFDFHGLGLAIKQAREEKEAGHKPMWWRLVGKTDRTIMNIENKGTTSQLQFFFQTRYHVRYFRRPVFLPGRTAGRRHSCRKHIDVLLNSMNEKELVVMEATAEGLKKARETEVQK